VQARGFFEEALRLQPDLAEAHFNLGTLERARGNLQVYIFLIFLYIYID